MTVEEKIKSVVESMKGVTYLFENWQTANVRADNTPLPAVLNVLPVSGVFNLGATQLKDFPNCMLAFMDKANFDFNGRENDEVVERCKLKAKEFILRLNESLLFKPVYGDISYSVFYDKLDVNVTGIVIELKLEEVSGIVLCPNKSVEELIYGNSTKG